MGRQLQRQRRSLWSCCLRLAGQFITSLCLVYDYFIARIISMVVMCTDVPFTGTGDMIT